MYNNILIPVALGHGIDVKNAITIARRLQADGAKITLVAVLEDIPSYVAEYAVVKPAAHIKSDLKDRLRAITKDQDNLEVVVMSGKPGVAIPDLAQETDADLIVIGSHQPGVEDYFLGSTASRVVRRAPCAVMVVR
jgi:nucleotide-binding universal stress UspA family protein